ncbi:hypothetical protein [Metakosakonia massiliensis]|uniref:Uncharacterized protein n=1 Tax=Phytobacter massiliensis TaxID=1485952 RepID=A0A6N3G7C3_9ENTR|nr:hypothetical protein [Phytobacter massiliensis]
MEHIFFEYPSLKPGVPDVQTLMQVIRSSKDTWFVIGDEVTDFVKKALIVNTTIISFKNCKFAFENGAYFVEFDAKGKSKQYTEKPDWFITPAEFARTQWLVNHNLADVKATEFIKILMTYSLKERRSHCDLLFGLDLQKTGGASSTPDSKTVRTGNRGGKTTKPKVFEMGSFELFEQFFSRMKAAVAENKFPTLQVLTGMEDLTRAPGNLKQGVRTWFKAITGDLPPNNKRVDAGNAELFCAPIRAQIEEIEKIGLENYYQALSQAVHQAGDAYISEFTFRYPR